MLDTIPCKHSGILAGETVMIFALASLLGRRMTLRSLGVAVAAMAFFYYVPFDNMQLSPNGDLSWARGITCSPELSKRSWPIGPLVMSWAVLMVISGFFAGVIIGTVVGALPGIEPRRGSRLFGGAQDAQGRRALQRGRGRRHRRDRGRQFRRVGIEPDPRAFARHSGRLQGRAKTDASPDPKDRTT